MISWKWMTIDEWEALTIKEWAEMGPIQQGNFLYNLSIRRGNPTISGNPTRLIERVKGSDILYQFYEPDPFTTREPYYYNTRINKLFKKIEFVEPKSDKKSAAWKDITEF